jgi:hypothetical protein
LDGTQSTGFTSAPNSLFSGLPYGSPDAEFDLINQALETSFATTGTTSGTASSLQAEELDALFGTETTVDPSINTLA